MNDAQLRRLHNAGFTVKQIKYRMPGFTEGSVRRRLYDLNLVPHTESGYVREDRLEKIRIKEPWPEDMPRFEDDPRADTAADPGWGGRFVHPGFARSLRGGTSLAEMYRTKRGLAGKGEI